MGDLDKKFEKIVQARGIKFKEALEITEIYRELQQERFAAKQQFLNTYRPRFPMSPSSALTCGRKLYYELCNFEKPNTFPTRPQAIHTNRVFEAGEIFETFEIGKLNQCKRFKVTHQQQRLNIGNINGLSITGSIDGILWLDDKPYALLDIKSSNTYKFASIKDSNVPNMSNFAQLSLYGCSKDFIDLWAQLGGDVENIKCILFYVNKDSLATHLVEFSPSKHVADLVLQRFNRLYKAFQEKKMPPRDYVKTGYPCGRYCTFSDICFPKNGVADPALEIEVPSDFDLEDLAEEDAIASLWSLGESSTYVQGDTRFEVELMKTKWKLHTTKADNGKNSRRKKQKAKTGEDAAVDVAQASTDSVPEQLHTGHSASGTRKRKKPAVSKVKGSD